MNDPYYTLRAAGQDELVIQKSRFIGYAAPCDSEEQALAFLRSVKEQHRDARHHCYAYIVGANSGIMRYSDDGEPGGTAGLPIISVLKNLQAVNCCVVVVRYFGGILLGTGGLVRAYTDGCKIAVRAAGLVRMEMSSVCHCELPYSSWDTAQHALQTLPAFIDSVEYGSAIEFRLCARTEDMPRVLDTLMNRTARKLDYIEEPDRYLPWDAEVST